MNNQPHLYRYFLQKIYSKKSNQHAHTIGTNFKHRQIEMHSSSEWRRAFSVNVVLTRNHQSNTHHTPILIAKSIESLYIGPSFYLVFEKDFTEVLGFNE